jgi:hypothetical protein
MRSWIITAALGVAALGLTAFTPGQASAHGPRFFVGVYSPGVAVAYPPPSYVVPAYPAYSVPALVVVTPAPVVVAPAPAPVVVTPAFGAVVTVRPRVYVRIR